MNFEMLAWPQFKVMAQGKAEICHRGLDLWLSAYERKSYRSNSVVYMVVYGQAHKILLCLNSEIALGNMSSLQGNNDTRSLIMDQNFWSTIKNYFISKAHACTVTSFEAVYCFICGRRRVAVRYRMICLVLDILDITSVSNSWHSLRLWENLFTSKSAVKLNNPEKEIKTCVKFELDLGDSSMILDQAHTTPTVSQEPQFARFRRVFTCSPIV